MKNASASKEVPKSLQCKLNTISFFFFLIKSATICRKRDELKVLSRHEGWSLQNNKPEETGFPESRPSELLDVTGMTC